MRWTRLAVGIGLGIAMLMIAAGQVDAAGSAPKSVLRIGVYDSRGVAIAWARSAEFNQAMTRLRADHERARAAGDTARAGALEKQGQEMQVRLHQRGFSTAGAGDLLAKVAAGLPAVARDAGVVLIVSKWEMPYKDPGVEIVDVTVPVAKLFKPDEQTLEVLDQLAGQPPIPFDELPLDANE
jgi:hypothetical protein